LSPLETPEMSARYEPIDGHSGFYRHGNAVAFRYRLRSGRQRWASAPTLRAAKRHREELQTDARRGQVAGPTERFDVYARAWADSYDGRTSRGLRPTTRDGYRRQLERHAIPYFGKQRLGEITPTDVREYVRHVTAKIAKRTKKAPARDTVRL